MSIDITTLAIAKEYTNRMIGSGGTGSGGGGGYYTPGVTQPTTDTMQISFAPSKSDMPAVDPVTVNLPVSENSGQNVELDTTLTKSGKAADAKATGDEIKRVEGLIPSIEGLAKTEEIPTKPEDIGAQPAGSYLTEETDPTVPSWAKQPKKPTYTASEVGARSADWMPTAQEVGALPDTYIPPNQTAEQVGADIKGTAASEVSKHNADSDSHNDLRLEIQAIREQLTAFLDVDEETLNELSELIARIVANQTSIAQLTTGKVSISDIIDNLTTNVANKPLSAAQGVEIKALIDGLSASLANYQPKGDYALASAVPTKVSQLANDKGYLIEHQDISHLLPRMELPYVTPQMYGAVGDGVTDDTAAFEAAFAKNSEVFLPRGDYLVTKTLDLSDEKKLYSTNREGMIRYRGSGSVFYLGRRTRISGIKVRVDSDKVTSVFNTDNRVFPSNTGSLMTEVHDIEVYFSSSIANHKTTLINIVASNKDFIGVSGFHNQSYSNIQTAGNDRLEYGIKICVSFDAPYTTGVLPWITNMRFNHIWLGSPEYAIKIHRENNSGTEINYGSIVKTEHMMFSDVSAQCTSDGHTKYFYDVEWCMAEFINCQPWDYHNAPDENGKYNIIGAGAWISEVNARRSPVAVAKFPSVTSVTPEEDPAYFIRTFFNFMSTQNKDYDYIDMKCRDIVAEVGTDEVTVEAIAQKVLDDGLTGIYVNVMSNPMTQVYRSERFSNSSQTWVDTSGANDTDNIDCLIIPIKAGTNLIRWSGNELSGGYRSVFVSNDLASGVLVNEHDKITVTTDNGDKYLRIDNNAGYTYAFIPFCHTAVPMNADNMIITINEIIGSGALKTIGDHMNNVGVHVTPEDKRRWDNGPEVPTKLSELSNDSGFITADDIPEVPTKTSELTNDSGFITADDIPEVQVPDLSGYALKSNAETWTFTLEDGSTVTKKVVLA